jgi:hypothetical protein
MDGKLPRYCVSRMTDAWAVRDRSASRIRINTDVVDSYPTRESARIRCRELNLAEIERIHDGRGTAGADAPDTGER